MIVTGTGLGFMPDDEVIICVALINPDWSSVKIEAALEKEGLPSAHLTALKLREKDLFYSADRYRRLERLLFEPEHPLHDTIFTSPSGANSIKKIASINPRTTMASIAVHAPGEVVVFDTCRIGKIGSSQVYVYLLIDAASSYVVARLEEKVNYEMITRFLNGDAIPAFQKLGVEVKQVLAKTSSCLNKLTHLMDINHKNVSCKQGQSLGYAKYFAQLAKSDFFSKFTSRQVTGANLRDEFNSWLLKYNHMPNEGFPNFGRIPHDALSTKALYCPAVAELSTV